MSNFFPTNRVPYARTKWQRVLPICHTYRTHSISRAPVDLDSQLTTNRHAGQVQRHSHLVYEFRLKPRVLQPAQDEGRTQSCIRLEPTHNLLEPRTVSGSCGLLEFADVSTSPDLCESARVAIDFERIENITKINRDPPLNLGLRSWLCSYHSSPTSGDGHPIYLTLTRLPAKYFHTSPSDSANFSTKSDVPTIDSTAAGMMPISP